jgi:hypothetical protein
MIKELILSNAELATLTNRVQLNDLKPGTRFVSIIDRAVLEVVTITPGAVVCNKVQDLYFNPIAKPKLVRVWYSSIDVTFGLSGCWTIAEFKPLMQTKLLNILSNFE